MARWKIPPGGTAYGNETVPKPEVDFCSTDFCGFLGLLRFRFDSQQVFYIPKEMPNVKSTLEGPQITYVAPKKEIFSIEDMPKWEKSEAFTEYMGFVVMVNEAVKSKKMTSQYTVSEVAQSVMNVLNKLDKLINETPPIDQPQRFGNKAFRLWFDKAKQVADTLLKEALPDTFHDAVVELQVYLMEAVGNYTRIDYGTGHEMAFGMFLCCLFKIGAFTEEDTLAVAFRVFNRYLELVRKLQLTYRMEPAGSHGAWSLDDFQFLPFVWGSSQLIDHPRFFPKNFPDEDIAASYAKDYMFLGCIQFIHKVKTGPFAEHSNQLWNISGVPFWSKVNSGLLKMYKVEVLSKFPVIQHTLFGNLLPIRAAQSRSTAATTE